MGKETPKNIDFHYIKSNSFRVVHCDGVWGGATPRGYIAMSVFSERAPIPTVVTQEVKDNRLIEPPVIKDGKKGIVREVDAEVIMDLEMAKSLVAWLQQHISTLEKSRIAQDGKGN